MPDRKVVLVDTSIVLRLIGLDGQEEAKETAEEFDSRRARGQEFVMPVTAIIEAGNRVAQHRKGNRRQLAESLNHLIDAASKTNPPWILSDVRLDRRFLDELLKGNSTGSDLVTLLADGRLGSGDIAILVERDQLRRRMDPLVRVEVWTRDRELAAHR